VSCQLVEDAGKALCQRLKHLTVRLPASRRWSKFVIRVRWWAFAQNTKAPGSATRCRMLTPLPPGVIHVQGGGSEVRAVGMARVWGMGRIKSTAC